MHRVPFYPYSPIVRLQSARRRPVVNFIIVQACVRYVPGDHCLLRSLVPLPDSWRRIGHAHVRLSKHVNAVLRMFVDCLISEIVLHSIVVWIQVFSQVVLVGPIRSCGQQVDKDSWKRTKQCRLWNTESVVMYPVGSSAIRDVLLGSRCNSSLVTLNTAPRRKKYFKNEMQCKDKLKSTVIQSVP